MPDGCSNSSIIDQFRESLVDCRRLYLDSARFVVRDHPHLVKGPPGKFISLMDDLHKGLLIKTFVTVAQADFHWSKLERQLGQELLLHAWGRWLEGDKFSDAIMELVDRAQQLHWFSLVRPFAELPPLREQVAALESVFMRLANLVAKADGKPNDSELRHLQHLHQEIDLHLRPLPMATPIDEPSATSTVQAMEREADRLRRDYNLPDKDMTGAEAQVEAQATRPVTLEEALAELDKLIGLDAVKQEVRSLANYLKLQQHREKAGLPRMPLSLHMVFTGNPGTGKTTVARIVGKIYGAMGVLAKGHLVETDRSGLVAEYAGQTGPKTNRRIDEALDGVLFIDEAYSLIAEQGDDPFGAEAVQTLLKRMEDDRRRLVVILAGYPEPIERLLDSNPGLSSRFHRVMRFEDYSPVDLARIFALLCEQNQFELPGTARGKLMCGLKWFWMHRDEHFGNGRLVRNIFEDSVRCLANRLAGMDTISRELLSRLEAEDLAMEGVPDDVLGRAGDECYCVICPGCGNQAEVGANYLGRRVACRLCSHRFTAEWGEPLGVKGLDEEGRGARD